ncbi:hypothetical protein SprV_0200765400 [Sparganum proliferum]
MGCLAFSAIAPEPAFDYPDSVLPSGTDHEPFNFALHSHSDKLNPREICHLDYISQFTSDIHHIDGPRNEVADALSRPSLAHLQLSPAIDLAEMAAEQRRIGAPCDEDVSELQLQELPLTTDNGNILCDVSTSSHRPFLPPSLLRKVFSSLQIYLTLGVELPKSWFPTALSGLGCTRTSKHGHELVSPVNGVRCSSTIRPPLAPSPALVQGSVKFTCTWLYPHPDDSLSPGCQRDGRAVSPPAEGFPTHRGT